MEIGLIEKKVLKKKWRVSQLERTLETTFSMPSQGLKTPTDVLLAGYEARYCTTERGQIYVPGREPSSFIEAWPFSL